MSKEHGVTLLEQDMQEIVYIVTESLSQKYNVSDSVLNINLTDYGYSCGDGCCYNYGTVTKVNGVELPCHNQDVGTILSQVLEHLGYKVEIEYGDDVE